MLPYGRHSIDTDDVQAVVEALQSDWLTTGPLVERFEKAFAGIVGADHAVAVSSGTAALHAAMAAIDIQPGDEVIVPAITFVATANAVIYQGGTPVFADVLTNSLLIDPEDVFRKVSSRTRAIVAVDYAGHPCDYGALREIANQFDLTLIADACHSLGASVAGRPVGSLADLNCFSLHPVKAITSGEGGVVTTVNSQWANFIRCFRQHGIETDHRQRLAGNTHRYHMTSLGFNYRITDFQCALALSQSAKLAALINRRREIARQYDQRLSEIPFAGRLAVSQHVEHAFHLYVIRWLNQSNGYTRDELFAWLRQNGVGAHVHYLPVYRHPYYATQFGDLSESCPNAECAYQGILTLPLFPTMTAPQIERVVSLIREFAERYQKAAA